MHWKLCRKDHDRTGTHRTLPEEGCDVKEDMSLHSYACHMELIIGYIEVALEVIMRSDASPWICSLWYDL